MKKKEREFIKNIQYSENAIAKKILRKYKIERWIYYTIFLLLTIIYLLWIVNVPNINNLILYSVIYMIFSIALGGRYASYAKKRLEEAIKINICPEGYFNINLYNAKKLIISNKFYNYTLNNIAKAYIQLGKFEEAKEIVNYVDKRKNNILTKVKIMENKMDIAFFTNNIKEFKEQSEKINNILKFIPKKEKKEILLNISLKKAVIAKDIEEVKELSERLEKKKNNFDKVISSYYRGVVLEKDNKSREREYKFVAENGNNTYVAKIAREKVNIENKEITYKSKKHIIYNTFNAIIILISLIFSIFLGVYTIERKNITWETGEVTINNSNIKIPCKVEEFEEKYQTKIGEINEYNLAEVKLGENIVTLYIEEGQIKGLKVETNNIDEELIKFPRDITLKNKLEEIKNTYRTGKFDIFKKVFEEKISENENIYVVRYIGGKYNIEIRCINNEVQSIAYVCKY